MAKSRQTSKQRGRDDSANSLGKQPEGFWTWMRSAWTFFEKVFEALKSDLRLAVLWAFGVLFLILLISTLVLGNLLPAMQLAAFILIALVITFLFWYTVPRRSQHSESLFIGKQAAGSPSESGSPDLVITSLGGPGRLEPLSGHPILTRKADGRPVYTGGFHVAFTLSHNGMGKQVIILRGLALDVLRYQPGPDPDYAHQIEGAAIIGAGVVKPHAFTIALLGAKPSPARWVVDSRSGEYRLARSANFFDTEPPRLITLATEAEVEEIKGSVLAQVPGFYEVRFSFDYSVGGKDRCQTTDAVLVYSDD